MTDGICCSRRRSASCRPRWVRSPTIARTRWRRSADRLSYVPFTPAFNASYQPAINVPLHWTADGLPVGIQLVAAYGREDVLIRVAAQLEAAAPWAHRRPDLTSDRRPVV